MKRRALLVALLLGLSLFMMESGAVEDDYADRLLFADGLYARGMYELALREYASLLKAFPEGPANDAATFRLAESLRHQGDLATAGRFYAHVVVHFRESPFRLRAAYRRARLYADEGDGEAALAHYEVILQAQPEPSLAAATIYYMGETLLHMQRHTAADAAFARLIEEHPDSDFVGYAWLKRGEIARSELVALLKESDATVTDVREKALAFYARARAVGEADARLQAEALFQMADVQFRVGAFEAAASLYRELLSGYPEDERAVQARLQAAWAAMRSNLYAEALAVADAALEDGDEPVDEWLYVKANSQRQLLQHDAAVRTYAELLRRFPASRFGDPARYETAVSYYQAGAFADAVREAERIRLTPVLREDVSWLLAESYAALNRPGEAIQYYRMVVRESEGGERARDALYRLGHQLQKQGSYREASPFFLQVAEQFPESDMAPQALFASGFALAQAGVHEEAVRDWRRLVQRYPEHPLVEESLYQRAMGEIRLKRSADALTTLGELLRRFPQGRYLADGHYWQGMLHVQAERYGEAEVSLRKAMEASSREDLRRDAQYQLGVVYQRQNRDEDALALLQTLVDSPARDKFPPVLLEWMAAQHGAREQFVRMAEAATILTGAQDAAWQQAGWVLKGRALLGQALKDEAQVAFGKALAQEGIKTSYAGEAALNLGGLSLARDAIEQAEGYFRQASKLAAGERADAIRARSLMGLGRSALARGSRSEASRLFMSVAILYDDAELVPESLFLAAEAFDALGRSEELTKVVLELSDRYPESEWTAKARSAWQI